MDKNLEQAVKLLRRDFPQIAAVVDSMKQAGLSYAAVKAACEAATTDPTRTAAFILVCAYAYYPPLAPA